VIDPGITLIGSAFERDQVDTELDQGVGEAGAAAIDLSGEQGDNKGQKRSTDEDGVKASEKRDGKER